MAARRCSTCNLNFPFSSEFAVCPQCEGDTSPMSNAKPMGLEEARALKPLAIKAVLPPYENETRELVAEIRQAEEEAKRRGPRWSATDVLEEWAARREAA